MFTWEIAARATFLPVLLGTALAAAQPASSEQAEAAGTPVDTTARFVAPEGEHVSGEVSGVWRRGSYIVTDVVTIPPEDTLIIEPGSTIYFMGPKERTKLNINSLGYLDVVGTDSLPIVMASALPPGDPDRIWGGILYVGNFADGRVHHVTFRNAEIGVQVRRGILAEQPLAEGDTTGGVPEHILRRATGPVSIRKCTIDSASFNGVVLVGVDSTVAVEDNLIRYCTSGISCEDGAHPVIRNNRILDNTSTGIICTGNSYPALVGNTIVGSATAGIICANGSNPIVDLCVIARCGIGISATKSNPQISRCTIANNDFSGVISYEAAAPTVSGSNLRGNGLAAIDNRSSGNIPADRCWWGYIATEARPAPVLDGGVRRRKGEEVPAEQTGRVEVTNSINSPSQDAPGTPSQAEELILGRDPELARRLTGAEATVTNGDTIYIRMVAKDENPYLEDEASIVLSTTTGNPEGVQLVLTERGAATGIYEGYVVASLVAGDPNIVMEVKNGDLIKVETVTTPPLRRQVMFVSLPPMVQYLRIGGEPRGVRLIDPRPVFSWRYWDNEKDPQAGTELQLGTDPTWQAEPLWRYQEAGQRQSYAYDGPGLARGQTCYLRVRVTDGYNWGRWTESYFRMNTAPPRPEPAYPTNGAIISARDGKPRVAVRNVLDTDGDAVSYLFEAFYGEDFSNAKMRVGGTAASPAVPADTTSSLTPWRTIPQLVENTRVWWRARSTDGLEESDWSDPWSFTLNTLDDAPQEFGLLEPQRDSTAATLQPRFEWEYSYDPDPDQAITFLLKFGRDPSLQDAYVRKVQPANEAIQFYQVPPTDELVDNSNYYWTVLVEQNDQVILKANTAAPDTTSVWKFWLDSGNDPPRIDPIPEVRMQEDAPASLSVLRYVHDPDNPVDRITLEARGTPHVTAEVGPQMQISFTPERDWYGGPETIKLTVTDPLRSVGIGELAVTVEPVNDPPVVNELPDETVQEDTDLRIDLNPAVRDIDNRTEEIQWGAATDDRKLTVNIARGVATVRGTKDWAGGPVPIRFTATDPGGLSGSTTVNVTVNPVNDPPAVVEMPLVTFKEDESATVRLDDFVNDPDDAKSDLTWTAEPDEPLSVTINPESHRAQVGAPPNFGGAERRVVFTVTDSAGLSNRLVARFNVESVNDPPSVAAIPDQLFDEDASLAIELDPFVSDPDNAAREMTWTAASGPTIRAEVDNTTRKVTFTAPRNWYGGPERIQLTARDPGGLTGTQAVNVTVNSVPEPPVFRSIPPVAFDEDGQQVLSLDDYLSDPDHRNDQLAVTLTSPANVRAELDARTRRVTISAPPNWNGGPETVRVEAADPDDERATATISVTVRPVNDPPLLRDVPPVSFREDESTSLTLTEYVSDADNAPGEMRWTFAGNTNVRAQVTGGVASFSAPKDWNGGENLTLTVSDPGGLTANGPVRVTVTAVNDPPVLSALPAVAFDEDGASRLTLNDHVSDVDNAKTELNWSVTGNAHVKVDIDRGVASFSADQNWHGAETLTFTVRDPEGLSVEGNVTVTVRSVNDPPVIARIPAVTFNEDENTSVDLAPYGSDVDGDPITWGSTSANENVRTSLAGTVLAFSAAQNWNGGPVNVTVTASDPNGGSARATIPVTVTPVNDPPVLSTIPATAFDEDQTAQINLNEHVADPDNTSAQMEWSFTGGTNVKVAVARGAATLSATKDWNGSETLNVSVRDPGGLSASQALQVTVRPVNDPPVLGSVPAVTFDEDGSSSVTVTEYVTDPDNAPSEMKWAFTGNTNVRAQAMGGVASFGAAQDWNGTESLTLAVTDPGNLTARATVRVTVRPVNDPPVLQSLDPMTIREDETGTLDLKAQVSDPDNTVAQLSWTITGATQVQASVTNGVATLRPAKDWHGSEALTVTVRDPDGGAAQQPLPLTVTPVNDQPVVRSIPAARFNEDERTTIDLAPYGSDVDGDALAWSASSAEPNLRASVSGGVLSLSAAENWSGGPVTITVTASDGQGGQAQATVAVTVSAVNDPPVLGQIPPVTFDEDGSARMTLNDYVTDPDNTSAQMRWSVSDGTNVGARIAQGVATLSATKDWSGSETLTVTVSDPGGLSASQQVRVTVNPVNDPPVLRTIPQASFDEDGTAAVRLTDQVTDPDDAPEQMRWTVSGGTNVSATVAGGVATIGATKDWNGSETLTVTVTDPGGLSASGTMRVTVRSINDPPLLAALPPVTFDEDESATVDLGALVSDPDHAPAQMSWSVSGTQNVSVRFAGAVATFSAARNWSGQETLTITVRDREGGTASQQVRVTVDPVNDPPQVREIPDINMAPGNERTVDLSRYASDPEGGSLTWEVSSQTGALPVSISGSTLQVTAPAGSSGASAITLTVRDSGGAEATVRVRVVVQGPQPSGQ